MTTKGKKTTRKRTLLIVESPSKAKVIGKYLGSSYSVLASVGHVRDLPKSRLGIDIENYFEPGYINIRGKGDKIKELKKAAASASRILLATDPDREGEAISWHLAHILDIDPSSECRIVFNEINKEAVKEAIKHPRSIDMGLVDAQQARRVLDRLVGYQISPLLWQKVRRGLSAGRVQSAALKMICDRENEITSFIPEEYWTITADYGDNFTASLSKYKGKDIRINTAIDAENIEKEIKLGKFIVESVKTGKRKPKPYAPFTTSSMQQDASIKLNFQTKKTMQVAQQLYEGIDVKGIGTRGLITYLRTDSVRVSSVAKEAAASFISNKFGKEYSSNNSFSNKNKDIQDAHEAIRPTDVTLEPEVIRDSLTADQFKLYNLVWNRFVASQMSAAEFDTVSVSIDNNGYEFRASGSRMVFDGWRKVYPISNEKDSYVPELHEGDELKCKEILKAQKFTQPPARYTEAGLVKEMEEKNIGRPSTYSAIITTLTGRRYVTREKKNLVPTQLGFDVTGILSEYFGDIVDVEFTGDLENHLDQIELKKEAWKRVIEDFYGPFSKELEVAQNEVEKIEQELVLSDEVCDVCGKPMAIKESRFGKFLACTGYPECMNTKPIVKEIGVACPSCGKPIIEKRTRRGGKIFYGCSGYPECKVSYWDKPTNNLCPKCGSILLEGKGKKAKIKCSNDKCNYSTDKE
ncbi:DNA topoisomerase I [Mogibacterium pumilum]|uniref:DNA topoisomerase 1 n=1 Tax=Mogibacterium pumilum TaxID=86332 RepID=A0A223AUA6_9FIRM|nr:DNA topoisomerase I [Mogibacterium pumilum]